MSQNGPQGHPPPNGRPNPGPSYQPPGWQQPGPQRPPQPHMGPYGPQQPRPTYSGPVLRPGGSPVGPHSAARRGLPRTVKRLIGWGTAFAVTCTAVAVGNFGVLNFEGKKTDAALIWKGTILPKFLEFEVNPGSQRVTAHGPKHSDVCFYNLRTKEIFGTDGLLPGTATASFDKFVGEPIAIVSDNGGSVSVSAGVLSKKVPMNNVLYPGFETTLLRLLAKASKAIEITPDSWATDLEATADKHRVLTLEMGLVGSQFTAQRPAGGACPS